MWEDGGKDTRQLGKPKAIRSNAMLDKWAERLAGQISDKVREKGFAIHSWGFDR